ncbi:MAG TPA: penicillin-binding transpeptidase domain-containing protein, partial [Pyrinomonadaceae bacterium]|nr:penicillin-binding transpeptidase domain-containing protein [Pyrinomonadaceae bacterium]
CFSLSFNAYASRRRGRAAASARAERRGRKGREVAARGRGGRAARAKAPAHETRAERRRREREEARADRRGGRRLSRRERLLQARREAEARRRAELARLAAIARARAIEQALRNQVAANIAKDDTTGEDLEVRRATLNALGNHIATVVVMDPKSGRIYSIVNQEWAVRRGFKPCSTIKLVTGLAGLSEHVIDPLQEASMVSLNNNRLDLTDALAFSNNGYFQNVSGHVGFEHMISYARQLGYGERTGINHANEYQGRVPLFKQGYAVNHMGSHGDDFEVTPIQLATLVSTIANGGTLLTPHLPRTPDENIHFHAEVRRQLSIPQEYLRRMLPGMVGAVNYGTGKRAYDPSETIAGKTGTCIGQGGWVGLFTSYAPVEDPQLAIAVVGMGPDARQHATVAIAGQIYKALAYRFGKRGDKAPYRLTPDILAPRPKVDPSAVANVSKEDAEEKAAEQQEEAGTNVAPADADSGATTNVKPALKAINPNPATVTPRTTNAKPAPTPAGSTSLKKQAQTMDTRPRRVNPNEPQ